MSVCVVVVCFIISFSQFQSTNESEGVIIITSRSSRHGVNSECKLKTLISALLVVMSHSLVCTGSFVIICKICCKAIKLK